MRQTSDAPLSVSVPSDAEVPFCAIHHRNPPITSHRLIGDSSVSMRISAHLTIALSSVFTTDAFVTPQHRQFSVVPFEKSVLIEPPRGSIMTKKRVTSALQMSEDAAAEPNMDAAAGPNIFQKLKKVLPPKEERQKLIPLALMFFCILFNYTILRDTKDVLMVTAPKSGAEVIPFIKTYCNLPVAIVSTLSCKSSCRMNQSIEIECRGPYPYLFATHVCYSLLRRHRVSRDCMQK